MSDAKIDVQLPNGTAIVFSDAHYWLGPPSTAHRGLVRLVGELKPDLLIANGDILDGARISKYPRIGWDHTPKLADELAICRERLAELVAASPGSRTIWPLGNHDARFENYLAHHAPEFAGVTGFTLKEHFPAWEPCWRVDINGDTVVKHRWKGGPNATLRNVMEAGTNIVTGHLHAARVSPYSNYAGTHFGVDCGTLADVDGPQFQNYTEMNPLDWRSAFAVLTFRSGKLLWPEHAHAVAPGLVSFRGRILEV